MNRRQYVAALLTTGAFSGCLDSGDGGESTIREIQTDASSSTPDATPTSEMTPTPESTDVTGVSRTAMASSGEGEPLSIPGVAKLTNHHWPDEYDHRGYTSGVVGRVENIGEKRLAEIYVEANFLDDDGTIIGERWDSVQFIRSGEFYNIHLPYDGDAPSDRVTEYELFLSASYDPITPLNKGQVELSGTQWGKIDDTTTGVMGTGTNVSDDRLRSVIVNVNFYDGNHLLYERSDKVSRVGSGQSFKWSVGYYRDDPSPDAVEDYTTIIQVNE